MDLPDDPEAGPGRVPGGIEPCKLLPQDGDLAGWENAREDHEAVHLDLADGRPGLARGGQTWPPWWLSRHRCRSPSVSGNPNITLRFCTACPAPPLQRLSRQET